MLGVASSGEQERLRSSRLTERNRTIVAIVGYRNATEVRACLEALACSTEQNFSISICENGGREAYLALIAALGGLVEKTQVTSQIVDERVVSVWTGRLSSHNQLVRIYLANANLGYAGGINVCIRQLNPTEERWSAVWVLNPDTEPHPQALAALVDRARQGDYAIVGSRIVFKGTKQVQAYGGRWRLMMARGANIGMYQEANTVPSSEEVERRMNYVLGASLYATNSFIHSVGLMDERYFLYCEEVDWCLRRGDLRLGYAHESVVYHLGSTTIGGTAPARERSSLSVYLAERNGLLLTRRFFPKHYPLVVLTTLLFTAKFLQAGAFKNFLVALIGWWAGVRGAIGPPPRWLRS
jgi:N-acetylglucosaminyl-diphospho-decaprenol L-rhamnosyltransferase